MRRLLARSAIAAVLSLIAFVALELAYRRTEAFRSGNRLYYRGGRATRAGRTFATFWTTLARLGLVPPIVVSLETIGARSGKRRAVPMVIARHGGHEYLVSMLGERSAWVANVRAAGGRARLRRGSAREVRLVEVPIAERAPIIATYLEVAGGARPHIRIRPGSPLSAFEAVAADYPVFRIDDVSSGAGGAVR